MATAALQTINAEVLVFPFTGLTAIQRQQSGIARAQVTLKFPQTTLSATSSGEIKSLRFDGNLPRNFAYVYAGGSIKIGRLADANVLNQSRGVFFDDEVLCGITGTTFQDSWKMLNTGVIRTDGVSMLNEAGNFRRFAEDASAATNHVATAGTYNGGQNLYQKVYKDDVPPRIIFRAENGDIDVTADVSNMVEDPLSGSTYIALGEMHFLQYDIDQAYNYLIHSPIPVR